MSEAAFKIDIHEAAETSAAYEERPNLYRVAVECLTAADGDWVKAAAVMKQLVMSDQALRDELLEPMIDAAIWEKVRKACATERRSFKTDAAGYTVGTDDVSASKAIGERAAREWLDYPLRGGLRLGEADKASLEVEIQHHFALARSNNAMGSFLSEVRKRIGDKLVHQCMSNQQLKAMAKKHIQ